MTEQTELDSDSSDDQSYNLFSIESQAGTPIQVNLTMNQKPLTMELDTGASYSLISEQTYKTTWPEGAPSLEKCAVKLLTYTGERVVVVGSITVTVCYNTQLVKLPLLIVKGEGPSLFGHNWLSKIKLDWCAINQVTSQVYSQVYKKVVDKYPEVHEDELGTLRGTTAKIYVDSQATPKFFKPCSVPYIFRERVEKELDR